VRLRLRLRLLLACCCAPMLLRPSHVGDCLRTQGRLHLCSLPSPSKKHLQHEAFNAKYV
jgi:hypothetical protein